MEPESTEVVATTASLAPLRGSAIVAPAVQAAQALEAQRAYRDLCEQLLDSSDYQKIGDKDFRKKSGWRKLAVAFNVTNEIVSREYERDEAGRIIRAEVIDRAIAPNGRTCDGLGACDLFEKCCVKSSCRIKAQWHEHCDQRQGGCDGTRHFSNPQHDIPATAATRARNRACADLFGMGEVSAEEIANPERGGDHSGRARHGEEDDQREWYEKAGWVDEEEHNTAKTGLLERLRALPQEEQRAFGEKRRAAQIELAPKVPLTKAEHDTMLSWIEEPAEAEPAAEEPEADAGDKAAPKAENGQEQAAQAEPEAPAGPPEGASDEELVEFVNGLGAGQLDAALAHEQLEAGGRATDKRKRLAKHWLEKTRADLEKAGEGKEQRTD